LYGVDFLTPQRSKAVKLIVYDRPRRELHVTYAGGRRFLYRHVPPYVFRQLKAVEMRGESVGQFVNWRVKTIFFDYSQVSGDRRRDAPRSGIGPAVDDRRADRQRQDRAGAARR
jgi:hypothetical protein